MAIGEVGSGGGCLPYLKKLCKTSINQGTLYRLAANDSGQRGSRPPPHAGKWLLEVR